MKKKIHPKIYYTTKITDLSTGKTFEIPSTKEEISVEVSNLSHPFYTGKQRIVDTENLVKKFENKRTATNIKKIEDKKAKRKARTSKVTAVNTSDKLTLKDMLKQFK